MNALFVDGKIHRYSRANVGIAVATENGLVVPVIRAADRKSVLEIAAVRADLVSRAREGKLKMPDLEDGTFTISNLGMYDIEQFIAVLNPPQVAILAVGSIEDRPAAIDGSIEIRPHADDDDHLRPSCDRRLGGCGVPAHREVAGRRARARPLAQERNPLARIPLARRS